MAAYMAARRRKRRKMLISILGGSCNRCETAEDLEFDHINPAEKCFQLSGKALDKPWESLLEEAKKCQLLCHEHHREKTVEHGETGGGWNKITGPEGFQHGTESGYMRGGCRCDACRKARHDARITRGELKGTRGQYRSRSDVTQLGRVMDC